MFILLHFFFVAFHHKLQLLVKVDRQPVLQVSTHLFSVLTVAVTDTEEVGVLELAEVGHGDPDVLIHLLRVGRRETGFGCKGKLGHTVCPHLLRVRPSISERLRYKRRFLRLGYIR